VSVSISTDGVTAQITAGNYALNSDCPECGARVIFPVEIKTRLTVTGDEGGKLRPVFSTKAVVHECGTTGQAPLFEGNGAPAAPEMSDR